MGTKAYLIGQGFSNIKKHSGKTFSTMLIICATMILIGLFLILYLNIEVNAKVITENQGLKAFISDDVEEENIAKLAEKIQGITNVKTVTYLDKAAALEDAKDTLKEYAYLLDGYEKMNPFPRSFVIVFETLESTENVKDAIASVDGIYKVAYNETIINSVISIANVGNVVIIVFGVIMLMISIFIISNTIKLSVYSNKREIYIMKYIGATSKFIKAPFIVSGIAIGVGSALFTWVIISLAYIGIYSKVPKLNAELGSFGLLPYSSIWYYVLVLYVLIGVFLGWLGSSIAIRKYLKDFKPSKIALKEEKTRLKEIKENQKQTIRKEKLDIKMKEHEENWRKLQEKNNELIKKQEIEKNNLSQEKKEQKQEQEQIVSEGYNESDVIDNYTDKYSCDTLEEAKKLRREGRRNVGKK